MIWNWWIGSTLSAATFNPRQCRTRPSLISLLAECRCFSRSGRPAILSPCPNSATTPAERRTFSTPAPKPSSRKHDQAPGRCPRQTVDDPADAGTHHDASDELAGELERLAISGRTARFRVAFPLGRVRPPCRKRCFKFAPTALKIVVADAGFMLLAAGRFFRFRLAHSLSAIATSLPGQTVTVRPLLKSPAT